MKLNKTFVNIKDSPIVEEYINSPEREKFLQALLDLTKKIAEIFMKNSNSENKGKSIQEAVIQMTHLGLQTQSIMLNDTLEIIIKSFESFSHYIEEACDGTENLRIIFLTQALSIGYMIITTLLDKTFLRYPVLEAEVLSKELSEKMEYILSQIPGSKEILEISKTFYKMKENLGFVEGNLELSSH